MNGFVILGNQTYQELDEFQLIQKCIHGDQHAYREFIKRYRSLVHRAIYKILGPTPETDDLIQQAFIEVLKSLQSFEGKAKLSTWVYRITINVCGQYLRKKSNRPKELIDRRLWADPELISTSTVEGDKQHDPIERKQLQVQIQVALDKIQFKKRAVLVLHDMEGRTMEEIAEIMNIPIGTVKSRLFHARDELKKKLEKSIEQFV